jgi:RNA polymerase sigma factor (sigma-70 family)
MKTSPLRIVTSRPVSNDSEAMKRVAAGDLGALGEVYDRHAASLLRFVHRTSPLEDPEDIVQTVFLRAASIASTYRADAMSAKPWLFGIALRVASEKRRSIRRMLRFFQDLGHHAPPNQKPESGARLEVERALARLTPAKRVVVILAEVEGFKCEEIAETLDIPIGTVWTRLHNGRRELRAMLTETPS